MKLLMIAMSGVRAHNPELTELGLTLPGFVERNKVIASLPSLSLLTLAGLTPPGWEVRYLEIADLRAAGPLPLDCDLVAISTFSAQVFEAYAIADHYRAHGIPSVMGGLHCSALPEEAAWHATSVVIGEGEPLWPRVLADFEAGRMKPFYQAEPGDVWSLADAPVPRFELLDPAKYNRITVQTSRGCPHRCAFCASSILLRPDYAAKPVEKVLAEIRAIKRVWPEPFIEFADDNSFVLRRQGRALMDALAAERVPWFTEADLSIAQDPDLLERMHAAGCRQVLVGFESPRAASLDGLELRGDWKRKRRERYADAVREIQSHGITVNGCFILGLDGDTPEVFQEVLDFTRASGQYDVQVTLLTAFPGTPLYEQMKAEGRLLHDRAWDRCTLFDLGIRPKQMTVEQLGRGFVDLVRVLYSAEETARRHDAFRRQWQEARGRRRAA